MADVDIDGVTYRIGRMNVFDQGHVASRVLPVVAGVSRAYAEAATKLEAAGGDGEDTAARQNEVMMEALQPITHYIAEMSDSDREYIWKKCLSVVSKSNGSGGWAPIMRNGALMFENDMTLTLMMRLTMEVIQDNLSPTLTALLGQRSPNEDSPSPSPS